MSDYSAQRGGSARTKTRSKRKKERHKRVYRDLASRRSKGGELIFPNEEAAREEVNEEAESECEEHAEESYSENIRSQEAQSEEEPILSGTEYVESQQEYKADEYTEEN